MANLKIGVTNLIDAATVTVQSAATPGAPGSNLQDYRLAKVWRSTDYIAYARADFGSAKSIDAVGAFGMNLAAGDSITINLGTTAGGTDVATDTVAGPAAGIGQRLLVYPATKSARYLEIIFTATSRSVPDDFEVGRIWAGTLYEFERNFSYGASDNVLDFSVVKRAPRTGVRTEESGALLRQWVAQLEVMTSNDRAVVEAVRRLQGAAKQILLIPDSEASDLQSKAILGALDTPPPITIPGFDLNATALSMTEDK